MNRWILWLRKHPYETHLIAFLFMIAPAIPLYLAAEKGATGMIWFLLIWVIAGNILVLLIR